MISSPQQRELDAALRQDLGAFTAKAFHTLAPGDRYHHNWHIDAIIFALMQVHGGHETRLVVNQPPRSLKSICVSVAFVAWSLGHNPAMRFACVSYSNELAATFARQFRTVISSDWYRRLFPNVRYVKDTETECLTSEGGGRYAVSVGGSFTGRGADVIIIDDPLKADEAASESARRTVNEWYAATLLSRLDDKRSGAIILVMQRLHEDDLSGFLLRQGGWKHLCLPAIAQEDLRVQIGPRAWHDFRTGDALDPVREPRVVLANLKRDMGSLRFSAQYLQSPIPSEGNLLQRKWINWYDQAPPLEAGAHIVQSWDIASTIDERNDWSVCTTWRVVRGDYYLLHAWRGRIEFPQLKRRVIELAGEFRPREILIEKAGPGLHMIQELRANRPVGIPLPIAIQPTGDKLLRMEAQAGRFEAGQVYLPRMAPWLGDLLHELLAFPRSRHDDQIDSVSQFLNWIESRNRRPFLGFAGPIIVRG